MKSSLDTKIELLNIKIVQYNKSIKYLEEKYSLITSSESAKEFRHLEHTTLKLQKEINREYNYIVKSNLLIYIDKVEPIDEYSKQVKTIFENTNYIPLTLCSITLVLMFIFLLMGMINNNHHKSLYSYSSYNTSSQTAQPVLFENFSSREKIFITEEEPTSEEPKTSDPSSNEVSGEYKEIKVGACDLSGHRQSNVKVDIGYDSKTIEREYYAYTNEHGQLTYVTAEELILQEDYEHMEGDGRYCSDEAKVDGVESDNLDEGHVIADSLGGVSNAYNITPQESNLNRSGEQAEMEEQLRDALESGKEVTNFYAEITYPDTKTQIPSHYYYSYEINGKFYETEFDNGQTSGTRNKQKSEQEQTTEPTIGSEPQFSSCSEREENGYDTPIHEGSEEYTWYNDGDNDGVVCE